MKTRLLTSLGIAITLVLMFVLKIYVSSYFFDAFFLIVSIFASYEFANILTRCGKYNFSLLIVLYPAISTIISILGIYFEIGFGYTIILNIACALIMLLVLFFISLIFKRKTLFEMKIRQVQSSVALFSIKKAFHTFLGFIYPSFLFLLLIFINHFDQIQIDSIINYNNTLSIFIIIFAFLIPIFTDSFAMLTGMAFGGKKLAPKISPNKTISGSIGGLIWCILLSVCVYLILGSIDYFFAVISNFAIWKFIIIIALGSVIAQIGDLFESALKRKAGIKDSGKILPGHGGMLDRIDSYIFVAPYLLLAFCFVLI